jgi:ABC-type Na+ transport system ATPase subunit NatA
MKKPALKIHQLYKSYRKEVYALKGISLEVAQGDFFGLLGPNGAGKSTAIGIVSSLVNKSSGQVQIFGHDLDQELIQAKSQVGLVPQEFNFNVFDYFINDIFFKKEIKDLDKLNDDYDTEKMNNSVIYLICILIIFLLLYKLINKK